MSQSGNTTKLMSEIFPDTESGEVEEDNKIKVNIKDLVSDLESAPDSESEEYIFTKKKKTETKKSSLKDSSLSDSFNQEIPSVNDALNEYFRLKEKLENEILVVKKKIINDPTLSKREKRAEYLKIMPKCVNCKRPSRKGTIFSINYHPTDDNIESYRIFKASCGNLADPCNLDIEIEIGKTESIDDVLNEIKKDINEIKNEVIDDKNKLLFGLITTDKALENFEKNSVYIRDSTSYYEKYLNSWNNLFNDQEKKYELEKDITLSYELINNIKDCIKKMNENNEIKYADDAANIYYTTLEPLLKKIRQLKYKENMVNYDDHNNCKLFQSNYTISDYEIVFNEDKVKAFDVGLKAKKPQEKKTSIIIESDSTKNQPKEASESKELTIKIQEPGQSKSTEELVDEPIIGKGIDGIDWHTEEYKYLWSRLPPALRNEFKQNIDWMNKFMHKCVNEKKNHGPQWNGCRLIAPPNLVIPPREMENGEYDFGVSIYNKVFNKLPKSIQNGYLTRYIENPQTKEKDYSMLIDDLNRLVEQQVNFGRGFF